MFFVNIAICTLKHFRVLLMLLYRCAGRKVFSIRFEISILNSPDDDHFGTREKYQYMQLYLVIRFGYIGILNTGNTNK